MDTLCITLYEPLVNFCGPLHTAFPDLTPGFERLLECRAARTWDVISALGPGCTKATLVACLKKDEAEFFKDSEKNPFIAFLGGKVLYDRLLAIEKDAYWGNSHLANIIRQCMVLHALEPMAVKLQCIVAKVTSSSNQKMDQSNIVKTLLSDPSLMSSMLGLMDSPESMQTLMSSLRTIVEGMMTEATSSPPDEDENEDKQDDEKDDDVDALSSPGTFLKRDKKKKKKNKHKNKKMKQDPESNVQSLLSMIGDMDLNDTDLKEISDDIQTMKPEDFSSIASVVSNMMAGGEGGGMQQMLQTLGGSGKGGMQQLVQTLGGSGKGELQQLLQTLGGSGKDGIQQMLQSLGGRKSEV